MTKITFMEALRRKIQRSEPNHGPRSDVGEHEGCGADSERAFKRWQAEQAFTFDAMTRQNIEYHDRIIDLENALRQIAGKRKLDACAAASMQAIAKSALGDRK